MVYVLDRNGNPLMPTTRHGHVRYLLRKGKAVVVKNNVFTIQLTYNTTKYVEKVRLGVDTGSRHIGLSATTKNRELFSAEAELRNNITDLLSTRKEQRRTRRNRLRHRPARFNNRVKSKHNGWLPPSQENKIAFHMKLINLIRSILPVSHVTLEVGSFDAQKINNPNIESVGYQQGDQMGFWNTREYVLHRDGHKCQNCKGKSGDSILNVHHIESRKTGGDAPNNLITLCETCHKAYHRGEVRLKLKRGKSLRDAAAMNVMKDELYRRCKNCYGDGFVSRTWGYITKYNRIKHGIEKAHNTDARMISGNFFSEPCDKVLHIRQVRRHNRQIHKSNILKRGILKRNQCPYKVYGFRLYDIVRYNGVLCYISGRRETGYFSIKDCDDRMICDGVSYRRLLFIRENRRIFVM